MKFEDKKILWIVTAALAVVLVIFYNSSRADLPSQIDSEWQAVFLSDGQVYFGHLEDLSGGMVRLSNVHYLKYGKTLQQNNQEENVSQSSQNLNLVKLGGEIHGPESEMFIFKDKIIFIEDLKESSAVVQAIKK